MWMMRTRGRSDPHGSNDQRLRWTLDQDVELSDTSVVSENMAGASGAPLFFPAMASVPPVTAPAQPVPEVTLDPAALRGMTTEELQGVVDGLLARLRRRAQRDTDDRDADGTLAISSMTAVWVISTVGKAFGRRLVRLSEVDRGCLRSVGGVAGLLRQRIADVAAGTGRAA